MLCLCCCSGFFLVSTSSCGVRASHCSGFSCCGAQALGTQASEVAALRLWNTGSVAVTHGLNCSAACGIFPDQGLDPSLLHWQAASLQLSHQGSLSRTCLNSDVILLAKPWMSMCFILPSMGNRNKSNKDKFPYYYWCPGGISDLGRWGRRLTSEEFNTFNLYCCHNMIYQLEGKHAGCYAVNSEVTTVLNSLCLKEIWSFFVSNWLYYNTSF